MREDEISELEILLGECWLPVEGGVENSHGKVNILLQTYISQGTVESFSLISDLAYVAQVSSVYPVSSSFFTCKTGKVLHVSREGEVWRCAMFSKTQLLSVCKISSRLRVPGGFEIVPHLQMS